MLTITCHLLRDVFEGGASDDPRFSEWPPSWMRLFSALVSVAEPESRDDDVLRTLEQAPPPGILASEAARSTRAAFVPTNLLEREATGHTTMPGRTNSDRVWARAAPRSPVVCYRWELLELSDDFMHRLSALCRRVPYLGRSTSPAVLVASEGEHVEAETRGEWLQPAVSTGDDERFILEHAVRSPFPGALDALRKAHRRKQMKGQTGSPWEVGRAIDYGRTTTLDQRSVVAGPYESMAVLRLCGPKRDGRDTARIAHATRRAIMSRAEEHLAVIHGHHDGDTIQIAFLGLPYVGYKHADGHLLGIALALPDLPIDELRVIEDALPAVGDTIDVTAGPLGVLNIERLSPLEASTHARALEPSRWKGPSRTWTTATPMVLDRFLKPGSDLQAEIRRTVVNSRLPEPQVLDVSKRPLLLGAPDLRPRDTLRRPNDQAIRPYRHVSLRFPEPVRGPVVAGSMRHYGLGLFVPLGDDGARDG